MTSEIQLVTPNQEHEEQTSTQPQIQIFKLGLLDSMKFKIWGHVKVGSVNHGKYEQENYLIRCERHGFQVTTPCGHYELLICPACLSEKATEPEQKTEKTATHEIESTDTLRKYLSKNQDENK